MPMSNQQILYVAVAVACVGLIVGAVALHEFGNDKSDSASPSEYCNDILAAVNKASAKQIEEYMLIEDTDSKSTLCTGESVGSRVRWIIVATEDGEKLFNAQKSDESFAQNTNSDTIKVMSKTLPCHKIVYKDGLVDGVGYWYTYTDSYDIIEYIGYDADGKFLHVKLKLDDKDNSTVEADVLAIIKAMIAQL